MIGGSYLVLKMLPLCTRKPRACVWIHTCIFTFSILPESQPRGWDNEHLPTVLLAKYQKLATSNQNVWWKLTLNPIICPIVHLENHQMILYRNMQHASLIIIEQNFTPSKLHTYTSTLIMYETKSLRKKQCQNLKTTKQ